MLKEFLLNYFEEELIDLVLNSKKYKRIYGETKSPVSKINSVDIELCKTLYIEYKMPIYKIAMLYGVSDATMRTYLIKNNVVLKGHKCGKNSQNDYFENIDTPDKAYFLGLIVADGCIMDNSTNTNERKVLSLSLTEDDEYILKTFNKYGNFNEKILTSHKEDTKPRKMIRISSSKIYDDLYNLKIRPRKSTENKTYMPEINNELIPHFIRGYFDGDGIAFSSGYIGFCGCDTLLIQIRDWLVSNGMSYKELYYNKSNHIYYLQWSAKDDRKKFFNLIYKDKKDLYLIRKYNKIKNKL